MINKKKILKFLIYYISSCLFFIILDEIPFFDQELCEIIAMIFALINMVILCIYYFKEDKINKFKLSENVAIFVIWILFSAIFGFTTTLLVDKNYLHMCTKSGFFACTLNGIEYLIFSLSILVSAIMTIIIKLMLYLIKLIKNNKEK